MPIPNTVRMLPPTSELEALCKRVHDIAYRRAVKDGFPTVAELRTGPDWPQEIVGEQAYAIGRITAEWQAVLARFEVFIVKSLVHIDTGRKVFPTLKEYRRRKEAGNDELITLLEDSVDQALKSVICDL